MIIVGHVGLDPSRASAGAVVGDVAALVIATSFGSGSRKDCSQGDGKNWNQFFHSKVFRFTSFDAGSRELFKSSSNFIPEFPWRDARTEANLPRIQPNNTMIPTDETANSNDTNTAGTPRYENFPDAFKAARQDARSIARKAAPKLKRTLSRVAHDMAYGAAFGACFASSFAKEMVPSGIRQSAKRGAREGQRVADEVTGSPAADFGGPLTA